MRCWHPLVHSSVVMLLVLVVLGSFGGGVAFGEVVIELGNGYVDGDPNDGTDSIGSGRSSELLTESSERSWVPVYELPILFWFVGVDGFPITSVTAHILDFEINVVPNQKWWGWK